MGASAAPSRRAHKGNSALLVGKETVMKDLERSGQIELGDLQNVF